MTIRKSAIAVRGIRGPGPTGKTSYIPATDPSGNLQWMKLGLLASKSDVSSGGVSPPIFTATTNGIVPASGGGTANFLRADATWAAPPTSTGANPSATASDVAVNGVATTFMRSDGAPAVQKTSSSVFGLCKVDGLTITASGGVISGVSSSGYSPGTVPTVVQTAFSVAGGNSAVFGVAPTNGNYLVAMTFNPTSNTTGSGWTKQLENQFGTDFGDIFTKVAGAGESTTQSPISGVSTTGGMVIWEIHGQNGSTPFIYAASQNEQSGTSSTPVFVPNCLNCLGLAAIAVVTTPTIVNALNIGVQDVLDNTGSRKLAAGHSDLSVTPLVGVLATFSTTASSKASTCLITS